MSTKSNYNYDELLRMSTYTLAILKIKLEKSNNLKQLYGGLFNKFYRALKENEKNIGILDENTIYRNALQDYIDINELKKSIEKETKESFKNGMGKSNNNS